MLFSATFKILHSLPFTESLEEQLECLCKLLSTIGKMIDHPKAKPRMDQYFEQMQKIIEKKKVNMSYLDEYVSNVHLMQCVHPSFGFRWPLHETRHDSCRHETHTGMKIRPVYMTPDMKLFPLSTRCDVKYERRHGELI